MKMKMKVKPRRGTDEEMLSANQDDRRQQLREEKTDTRA